ncbi:MAG: hypothetical protein IKT61_03430 [Clostridia bacterium]|nr:hypothetical protein [Clostridia bacterium]
MKRIVSGLLFVLLLTVFSACGDKKSTAILDNSDKSYFVDFYTEGDEVFIECVLNIYSEKTTEVTICAIDNDNVQSGLLASPNLTGIDKGDMDDTFRLEAGENKVVVLFRGDYAGIYSIAEREIPRFIEIIEE